MRKKVSKVKQSEKTRLNSNDLVVNKTVLRNMLRSNTDCKTLDEREISPCANICSDNWNEYLILSSCEKEAQED